MMVRNYKKISNRRSWSDVNMIAALHAVKEENMSCNLAAKTYEVPEATLRRYAKKKNEDLPVHGGRFRQVFNKEQQEQLRQYIIDIDRAIFGLTNIQCRKLAFDLAEANKNTHCFNKEHKMAGSDWLNSFLKRHGIILRTSEATSVGRTMGYNRIQIDIFFEKLENIQMENTFSSHYIYNCDDEFGFSVVPTLSTEAISSVDTRFITRNNSTERGENITIVCCCNAGGCYIPPFFIFPNEKIRTELLEGCPPGTDAIAQQHGWMTTESFVMYLKHFIKYSKCSPEFPVLLLVNNHASHVSLDAINICRSHGIIMLGFPPHTSHILQPLDVSFFGSLKAYYSQACNDFMVSNPDEVITDKIAGKLFGKAYCQAATIVNAVKGFEACGIVPFNPHIFNKSDSELYDTVYNDTLNVIPSQQMKNQKYKCTSSLHCREDSVLEINSKQHIACCTSTVPEKPGPSRIKL
ncbi:tigger transposable element-derived protein 6-like isoform X2 [Centruroides sculpturatus]|uniref:tigger transposable element-derived protein 6-like isoform X2 n=1 Tax=Centruroides sculpturatus TaxID=218467 RepID=UPI000C6E5AFA|nr:tigger transposable element-derived protein 6-like isoform X2 [Centruroides sculpturatus]